MTTHSDPVPGYDDVRHEAIVCVRQAALFAALTAGTAVPRASTAAWSGPRAGEVARQWPELATGLLTPACSEIASRPQGYDDFSYSNNSRLRVHRL